MSAANHDRWWLSEAEASYLSSRFSAAEVSCTLPNGRGRHRIRSRCRRSDTMVLSSNGFVLSEAVRPLQLTSRIYHGSDRGEPWTGVRKLVTTIDPIHVHESFGIYFHEHHAVPWRQESGLRSLVRGRRPRFTPPTVRELAMFGRLSYSTGGNRCISNCPMQVHGDDVTMSLRSSTVSASASTKKGPSMTSQGVAGNAH